MLVNARETLSSTIATRTAVVKPTWRNTRPLVSSLLLTQLTAEGSRDSGPRPMPTTLRRRVLAVLATLRGRSLVTRVASAKLPTEDGAFDIHVYESLADGATHVALVKGELG